MARIIRGANQTLYVWKNMALTKSRIFLFVVLLVMATLLFVSNIFPYATIGIIMIPLSYTLGVYSYRKYLIWAGGSVGERQVAEELSKLDDSYTVISGVVIPPNRGDTDHIVFGRNGIFVIESKNVGGEVSCEGDEWDRRKTGRMGGVYELRIGSPSRQVKRNAKVLKDFLLSSKDTIFKEKEAPHIWVNSIVVFTNRDVKLSLRKPTVEVLKPHELLDYITEVKPDVAYSKPEIERMASLVMRHSG